MYVDDETRLRVMRDAAQRALDLAQGQTLSAFLSDPPRQDAVAWSLSRLGQAAAKLTPEARAALGGALTARLLAIHAGLRRGDYAPDPSALWTAVAEDLPPLHAALAHLLAEAPPAPRPRGRAPTLAARLPLDRARLVACCERHPIRKLSLFGSALRDDFGPASDVDLLVEFEPGASPSLLDLAGLELELSAIVGRQVDLREPEELSAYFRQQVLDSAVVVYERR
jgi:hypothetical protein